MAGRSPTTPTVPAPRASRRAASMLLTGVVAALWSLPAGVSAQSEPTTDSESSSPVHADYQIWGTTRDSASFAGPGPTSAGPVDMLHQRLRLYADKSAGDFRGVAEVDLATGLLAERGVPTTSPPIDSGTSPAARVFESPLQIADPRQAFIEARTDEGQTEWSFGLQTSHWGLGIRTNDGAPEFDRLFNHSYGGDRRVRGMVTIAPFRNGSTPAVDNFLVALGGDLLYRDEDLSLRRGDRGGQGFLAFAWESLRTRVGQYTTFRSQRDVDGTRRQTATLDYFAEHLWTAPSGWDLRLAAEAVFTLGSLAPPTQSATDPPESVRGTGLAGEFRALYRPADVRLTLDGGFASGDSDPYDDSHESFHFDPNYRVGLILFDSYLPAVTRISHRRVSDPNTTSPAPELSNPGTFARDGGVHNAAYVHPTVVFGRPDGLSTGVGLLWARAAQPWSDPHASFLNGGAPTGIAGRSPASRDLGWEIDTAARYRHQLRLGPTLEFKTEYGIFLPGKAFAAADGSQAPPVNLIRGTVGAFW